LQHAERSQDTAQADCTRQRATNAVLQQQLEHKDTTLHALQTQLCIAHETQASQQWQLQSEAASAQDKQQEIDALQGKLAAAERRCSDSQAQLAECATPVCLPVCNTKLFCVTHCQHCRLCAPLFVLIGVVASRRAFIVCSAGRTQLEIIWRLSCRASVLSTQLHCSNTKVLTQS
jgi:hypothetical protein